MAEKYGIKAMPTIILVQGTWDNKVDEVVGASKDKIDALFEKAASLKKWLYIVGCLEIWKYQSIFF